MKKVLASVLVGIMPLFALAQTTSPGQGIGGLFNLLSVFLNRAVPLIIGLAVVFFLWNVFRYAVAGDEDAKQLAKKQMVWGIVGLFVMVSVWGLVAILQSTFHLDTVAPTPPSLLP